MEDDLSFGAMLQKWFERNGYASEWHATMGSAQERLFKSDFDVILSDLRLPDGDGITLLNWLNERKRPIPVIIMTSYGEIQTAVSAIKLGAFDFLEKPINPSLLKQKIEAVFDVPSTPKAASDSSDNRSSRPVSSPFVEGISRPARHIYESIDLVAPTLMSVMITGESGTGKEHIARLIYKKSLRVAAPFVAVDCGGLSSELAPSELFGHKKGSFTSAINDKTGFFVKANGGTLFLDEVGNMPYGVQKQLLRTLQEKKVRPVGASTDIEVDVRIVTATNENLTRAIATGTFREDLFHRLNEFMIEMPPLRACREDIPLYVDFFIAEANIELNKQIKGCSGEALRHMEQYAWPGNLRELRNVIRRSALFATGDTLTAENLPPLADQPVRNDPSSIEVVLSVAPGDEKEVILRTLERTNGNKSKAARLLGIDRKTLYNKLHAYGIKL